MCEVIVVQTPLMVVGRSLSAPPAKVAGRARAFACNPRGS